MKSSNHWKNLPKKHPRRKHMRMVQAIRLGWGFQVGACTLGRLSISKMWRWQNN